MAQSVRVALATTSYHSFVFRADVSTVQTVDLRAGANAGDRFGLLLLNSSWKLSAVSGEINSKLENVAVQYRCSSGSVVKLDDQVSDCVRQLPRLSGAVLGLQHDVHDLRPTVDALSEFCEELSGRLRPFFR